MSIDNLVAPSGVKEALGPDKLVDRVDSRISQALLDAKIHKAPLVDAGEGFARILVRATGGTLHAVNVTGPTGYEVEAEFGFLGSGDLRIAVLDAAAAAGSRLVPRDQRDPLQTTTYGVGELIKAALDAGAEVLLIGCGDSGSSDAGAGMAQALGVDLLDVTGRQIAWGGGALTKLIRIDVTKVDPRLRKVKIYCACNWNSILCGPRGIAKIFSSQKGASPEAVQLLSAAFENYADVVHRDLGIDVRTMPGSGAAGGLGTALHVFLNATLCWRYDVLKRYIESDKALRQANLIITGEGCLDDETPVGRIPVRLRLGGLLGIGASQES